MLRYFTFFKKGEYKIQSIIDKNKELEEQYNFRLKIRGKNINQIKSYLEK